MGTTDQTQEPTVVTVVHSLACHFCDDAQVTLTDLGREFALTVDLVESRTPRGKALARRHRSPMFPLVLVGGAFFSFGRLPGKKLRKQLIASPALVAVA